MQLAVYWFSGKWFQKVVILCTRLEGAQCRHFVLLAQPETYQPLEVTVAPEMCMQSTVLTFLNWLMQRVYPTFPGQVGNSLMQISFCLHWWMAWWPEKCDWEIAVSEARGRKAGRPSAGRVYAVIKYKEFHVVWILLSCIWRGRGWMPLWVKATFLLLLSGLNLVVVRGA